MLRHGPHVRRHEPIRLGRWHERSVYASVALLLGSGVLWLVFHYFLRVQDEYGARPHPLEYQWLRLHGAAAMLSLIALGSMLPVHVRRAWELRKNLATGIVTTALLALLAGSGYALYYFAGGAGRSWISAIHWGFGLALAPVLAWHVWRGQIRRATESIREFAGAVNDESNDESAADPRTPASNRSRAPTGSMRGLR